VRRVPAQGEPQIIFAVPLLLNPLQKRAVFNRLAGQAMEQDAKAVVMVIQILFAPGNVAEALTGAKRNLFAPGKFINVHAATID
jgi:hypothetical protein